MNARDLFKEQSSGFAQRTANVFIIYSFWLIIWLHPLDVSQAQKVKVSGDDARDYALYNVCPQLLFSFLD